MGMKTELFQSCSHHWVFQIWWHNVCSTFTASSFRIWNSFSWNSITSASLVHSVLLKTHLTSHCRMPRSRWVITPSWLSRSLRPILYRSSMYFCHLFLISYVSLRSLTFLAFIMPIFAWNVTLVSLIFLKTSLVKIICIFSRGTLLIALRWHKGGVWRMPGLFWCSFWAEMY